MRKPNVILVVDDSAAVRALLTAILTAAGYEVVAADGARAALRQLRTLRPALILTDYAMPGLDGHAFVRLVRRDVRLTGMPVFVVSSETAREKHRNMSRAGVNGWLGKPIDLIRLLTMIEDCGAHPPGCARRPRLETEQRARTGRTLTTVAHQLSLYVLLLTGLFTNNGSSLAILGQL